GSYTPIVVEGPFAEHIVSFARRAHGECLIAVVPRLTRLLGTFERGFLAGDVWGETRIVLPMEVAPHSLVDVFTGRRCFTRDAGALTVRAVLDPCPVALLHAAA